MENKHLCAGASREAAQKGEKKEAGEARPHPHGRTATHVRDGGPVLVGLIPTFRPHYRKRTAFLFRNNPFNKLFQLCTLLGGLYEAETTVPAYILIRMSIPFGDWIKIANGSLLLLAGVPNQSSSAI